MFQRALFEVNAPCDLMAQDPANRALAEAFRNARKSANVRLRGLEEEIRTTKADIGDPRQLSEMSPGGQALVNGQRQKAIQANVASMLLSTPAMRFLGAGTSGTRSGRRRRSAERRPNALAAKAERMAAARQAKIVDILSRATVPWQSVAQTLAPGQIPIGGTGLNIPGAFALDLAKLSLEERATLKNLLGGK